MNNQHKILLFGLILASFFLNGCSQTESNNNTINKASKFEAFNHFPLHPFLNLNFNTSVIAIKREIETQNYIENSDLVFTNKSDSTSIILVNEDDLTEFKLYLKGTLYLEHNQELFNELSVKSTKTIGTHQFAEMSFHTTNNSFKLTYFTTKHSVRISYELLKSHH